MRSRTISLLTAAVLLATSSASAQSAQSTRVLVPIVVSGAPGMFNSLWTSELVAFNTSAVPVGLDFSYRCLFECPSFVLGSSDGDILPISSESGVPAALIRIPAASVDSMEFALRVRDVSRQSDSWGTEVPVVREDRAFRQPFDLLNVPLQPRFRQTLRIYDFEDRSGGIVRLQFYNLTNGQFLKESQLALLPPRSIDTHTPAYVQADLFGLLGDLAGVDRIRVRISPTSDAQRLWAMISVTNNVTQEVTVVTPR